MCPLTKPPVEFRSPQNQFGAEHMKQRSFRIRINRVDPPFTLRGRAGILPSGSRSRREKPT
jgi:hypothetical protein